MSPPDSRRGRPLDRKTPSTDLAEASLAPSADIQAACDSPAYERLLDRLEGVRRNGDKATARCPAHEDSTASLSLKAIEGQTLMYCHAGCDTSDVMAALGMTLGDLYDDRRGETYRYDDDRLVHRIYVNGKKEFPQSGNKNGQPTLYRRSKVTEAVVTGQTTLVCEGEKDVHALESLGAVATTAPMGAANVGKCDLSPLHGGHIIAVVHNDDAGQKWALQLRAMLDGKAKSLKFVKAAVDKPHADAADHIAAGYGLDELVSIEVTPEPEPNPLLAGLRTGTGSRPRYSRHSTMWCLT